MKSFFRTFDGFLEFRSPISKTGLALLVLGAGLTAISFAKGIQVLMFIPAFVLAILLFSALDIFFAARAVRITREERTFVFSWKKKRDFCFFRIAADEVFLTPRGNLFFAIPHNAKKIRIFCEGKFGLFRKILLFDPPKLGKKEIREEDEDFYFQIREYENGDDTRQIDALRSAKSEKLFVREKIFHGRLTGNAESEDNEMSVWSGEDLRPRKDVTSGERVEWFLIFLTTLGAQFEFHTLYFSFFIAGIFGIVTLFFRHRKLPKKALNAVALLLFFASFWEGAMWRDPVLSGSHFLIALSAVKHAFVRERRDGFLHLFLALFVFVALSLFSFSVWFFALFFPAIFAAISLFSIYAGGEKSEEVAQSFGRPKTRKSRIQTAFFVFLLTILLFFLLPHGEARLKTNDLLIAKMPSKTGFSDEVSLNDIREIKKDFSKKIILEDANFEEVGEYSSWYWRGKRFDFFDGTKWFAPKMQINMPTPVQPKESESLRVHFLFDGEKNLFAPAAPAQIIGARVVGSQDGTISEFGRPQKNDLFVNFVFASEDGKIVDADREPEDFSPRLSSEVEKMFENFWAKIPQEIQQNPRALEQYVREHFLYSIENPAQNIEDFLYGAQRGHCEFFATTLAVTLQKFGFTATLVNGFHGGEWNESADAWIVRNDDAHSWVEVLENGKWKRYDPTPSQSPQSVWWRDFSLFQEFTKILDAFEIKWSEWIVGYTGSKQRAFFASILSEKTILFSIIFGIFAFFFLRKKIQYFWKNRQKTSAEHFADWLRKNLGVGFLLEKYEHTFPKLVAETRLAFFREDNTDFSLLRKKWKKILAKKEQKRGETKN